VKKVVTRPLLVSSSGDRPAVIGVGWARRHRSLNLRCSQPVHPAPAPPHLDPSARPLLPGITRPLPRVVSSLPTLDLAPVTTTTSRPARPVINRLRPYEAIRPQLDLLSDCTHRLNFARLVVCSAFTTAHVPNYPPELIGFRLDEARHPARWYVAQARNSFVRPRLSAPPRVYSSKIRRWCIRCPSILRGTSVSTGLFYQATTRSCGLPLTRTTASSMTSTLFPVPTATATVWQTLACRL